MNEHDDLIARLRALGEHPVDPATASRHLTAMAAVAPRSRVSRFARAKVVAAFAAGLVLGGTSLASAGVMGETAQNTVADAAEHVGVNLPGGTERVTNVNTPNACKVGGTVVTARNHGDYVRQGGDPHDPCGKPLKSTADKAPNTKGSDNENRSECAPPWAGKGKAAKDIKAQNPNWAPPAGCADTENGTETPDTGSHTNQAPTTLPPAANQDHGQNGKATADQNKPTTTPTSVNGQQTAGEHDSTGTVESGDHTETPTPSSTVPRGRP